MAGRSGYTRRVYLYASTHFRHFPFDCGEIEFFYTSSFRVSRKKRSLFRRLFVAHQAARYRQCPQSAEISRSRAPYFAGRPLARMKTNEATCLVGIKILVVCLSAFRFAGTRETYARRDEKGAGGGAAAPLIISRFNPPFRESGARSTFFHRAALFSFFSSLLVPFFLFFCFCPF